MLSNYSFPKTLKENYIDLDIIGGIQPNTEYALYITCDSTTLTNDCWCGFVIPDYGWSSNSVYYGDNTRYFVLKTNENVNNSKFRIRGDKGVTINHIRLIKLVTNSKYSRIERFLYALYSLDSSDLPIPQSRIEELYNCLVTGEEAPTFKPLSRVEKYLMAILGAYDVDSLPNPLSRVEVLLYKLATGDDNLDDIESFLSRHEELLAEIIRNGGVGGNIDIEYVLYTLSAGYNTLYNTAEKPVKSAVLKGDTIVNIAPMASHSFDILRTPVLYLKKPLETGKQYTLIMNIVSQTVEGGVPLRFAKNNDSYKEAARFKGIGLHKSLYNATDNFNQFAPYIYLEEWEAGLSLEFNQLMIIEGDYTNVDIPYFEGMKSVENPVMTTTGKNLFNISLLPQTVNIIPTSKGYTLKGYSCGTGMLMSKMFQNLIVGKRYVLSFQSSSSGTINAQNSIGFYNANTEDLLYYRNNESFILTNEMYYERSVVLYGVNNEITEFSNVQLEEGSVATEYEPYKSTTVTCNEDVELHGVGEVKDELNLLTGELTQRVGEIVFDGSENWLDSTVDSAGTFMRFYTIIQDAYLNEKGSDILCDRFTSMSHGNWDKAIEGIHSKQTTIHINIPTSKLESNDASGFKKWLSSNPVTVCYRLATESIKTVDISVVNQDGNNTELKTFDDITYVTLSSERAIPEAELEVATKNEEVLDTMSLRMDDIYAAQTTLEETSNTQSENVDATMFATTEIYEELL